jgi:hypothetical protein
MGQQLCSSGAAFDPWIDARLDQARALALDRAAAEAVLAEVPDLQKTARREF